MNLEKFIKFAAICDSKKLYKLADYITDDFLKLSETSKITDPTKQYLESIDQVMNDPNLFKDEPAEAIQEDLSNVKPIVPTGTPKEFLNNLSEPAKQASAQTGGEIPASVILAIGAWESGWGKSSLAKKGNYFGIKNSPTSGGSGSVKMKTKEFDGGEREEIAEFALFENDAVSAMKALPNFLKNNKRYKNAIKAGEIYKNTKDINDLDKIVDSIFDAGYSTDKAEPSNIKKLIRSYNLQQYD